MPTWLTWLRGYHGQRWSQPDVDFGPDPADAQIVNAARRALWMKFRQALKKDTVRLYVWPYYIATLAWGIYGTFFAAPNTVVGPVMGQTVYNAWVWTCIWAPSFVMLGMVLPKLAGCCMSRSKARWLGECMQLGGNLGVGFVLAALEYTLIVGITWGTGSPLMFFTVPYVLGCIFLALRNALELVDAEWERPEETP